MVEQDSHGFPQLNAMTSLFELPFELPFKMLIPPFVVAVIVELFNRAELGFV